MLNNHFSDAFRCAHHAAGIHCFVGGDRARTSSHRNAWQFRHMPRAHHIVQDRLGRMMFHERHMLVRSRVKHHIWSVQLEELLNRTTVTNISDDVDDLIEVLPDFAGDLVKVVFVFVEKDQPRRMEPSELANELRTDRAACAGYEDPAARNMRLSTRRGREGGSRCPVPASPPS